MPLMKIFRRAATLGFTFATVFLLGRALGLAGEKRQPDEKRQPVEPASIELFDIRNIEGWAVYINKQDLADHAAEMTESYYGVNDHFPFLQFEARRHDPETCRLLAGLWGGKAK